MENKEMEIPFGAKDSELIESTYHIPYGMEAIIEDDKVIIRKKESDAERIRKDIVSFLRSKNGYMTPNEDWDFHNRWLPWLEKQGEPQDKGEISDGYHTFNELYYYRMLYNAAFFNMLPKEWVHKSKKHHDGEDCFGGGWFIVMANLPTGQISNHYELKDWDLFQIPEKEVADKWDGHTPQEAADRLHKYLLEKQDKQPSAIRWYDVSLIPQEMEELLVEWDGEDATWHEIAFYHADTKTFWNGTRQVENVTRWCYITDWLEKKGEQNYKIIKGKSYLCVKTHNYAGVEWIKGTKYYASDNYTLVNQGCECYCPEYSKKEHNNLFEEVIADKVEPKFKVGDWVIDKQDIVHQIANVIENVTYHTYSYDIVGGGYFNDNTEGVRLWSIQDAKDGDILASNKSIFIFQEEYIAEKPTAYCGLMNGLFIEGQGACWTNEKCYPATKEQRDLLFSKMKDAGYEWDAEKKELKKISQEYPLTPDECIKSAWGEEDEEKFRDVIRLIEQGAPVQSMRDHYTNWLKSLKERLKGDKL